MPRHCSALRSPAGDTLPLTLLTLNWRPTGTALPSGDALPAFSNPGRVRVLTPAEAKGLEFDLVVLVDPESFGTGVTGAVDRYVAMTRATQSLVILTSAR